MTAGPFYTLEEIAKALGRPRKTVMRWANEQGWVYKEQHSRGAHKKRRYPAASLPTWIREILWPAWVRRGGLERAPAPATKSTAARPSTERQRLRWQAEVAIVKAFEFYIAPFSLPRRLAAAVFRKLYLAGQVPGLPAWVWKAVADFSESSLIAWCRKVEREGAEALLSKHGRHRKGTGVVDSDPALKDFLVGNLAARPHLDAAQAIAGLRARFADGRRLPSYRTVQRFLARWKAENAGAFLAVRDPDAHRSRLSASFGAAADKVVALNQLWEWDATPADVMCAPPGETPARHALVGAIDVWSRRARVVVTPTSNSTAITAVLRKAMLAWGVPRSIKGDNGQDFTSFHVTRALADLQVRFIPCPPYTPEGKPHIERFFRTLSHQFLELLPGYVGHSVAERQAIRNRRSFAERRERKPLVEVKLTAAELQARVDAWIEDVYERNTHRGLGASPFARAAAWRGDVARIDDERALDVLLAEAPDNKGSRTVGKKGIAVQGLHYIAPELGERVGRKVMVRLDVADLGRVTVHDADSGQFICAAVAPEVAGVDRRAIAVEARKRQRAYVAAGRKALKRAAREAATETIADEILAAAARAADRVVAFPEAASAHETPALAEALKAALAGDGAAPAERRLTVVEQEALEQVRAGETDAPPPKEPISDADWLRLVLADPAAIDADQRAYALELIEGSASLRQLLEIREEEGRRRVMAGGPVKKAIGD